VPPLRAGIVRVTWRLHPSVLRAAWWALTSLRTVRRQLADGVAHAAVPAPPPPPLAAGAGVDGVLTRARATCLEAALVRQRWLAAQGMVLDVVIGLPASGFGAKPAHAWVDGLDPVASAEHTELYRLVAEPNG
jgi:hypothetical protein